MSGLYYVTVATVCIASHGGCLCGQSVSVKNLISSFKLHLSTKAIFLAVTYIWSAYIKFSCSTTKSILFQLPS